MKLRFYDNPAKKKKKSHGHKARKHPKARKTSKPKSKSKKSPKAKKSHKKKSSGKRTGKGKFTVTDKTTFTMNSKKRGGKKSGHKKSHHKKRGGRGFFSMNPLRSLPKSELFGLAGGALGGTILTSVAFNRFGASLPGLLDGNNVVRPFVKAAYRGAFGFGGAWALEKILGKRMPKSVVEGIQAATIVSMLTDVWGSQIQSISAQLSGTAMPATTTPVNRYVGAGATRVQPPRTAQVNLLAPPGRTGRTMSVLSRNSSGGFAPLGARRQNPFVPRSF